MSYCLYGQGVRGITVEQLMQEQREHGLLLARAENSGCEGMYCEVAKWNEKTKRYERYAFEKYFGGEHPDHPDAGERETAELYAKQINCPDEKCWDMTDQGLIHSLPNYGEPDDVSKYQMTAQRVYVHPNEKDAPRAVYVRIPEAAQRASEGGCSCGKCDGTGKWDTLAIPLYHGHTWPVHWPDMEKTGVLIEHRSDPYTLKTFDVEGQTWKVSI